MLFLCPQSPFTAEMMENSLLLVFLQPKQIPGFLHMRKQKPLDYRRDERVEEEEGKKRQDLSITYPCLTTQEEMVVASLQATLEKKSNNTSSSSRKIHSMAPIQDLLQPPTAMDQPRNNSPLRRSEIFQELQAIPYLLTFYPLVVLLELVVLLLVWYVNFVEYFSEISCNMRLNLIRSWQHFVVLVWFYCWSM